MKTEVVVVALSCRCRPLRVPIYFLGAQNGGCRVRARESMLQNSTVASKLITDIHFAWGILISNYRERIVLPEELNLHYRDRSVWISAKNNSLRALLRLRGALFQHVWALPRATLSGLFSDFSGVLGPKGPGDPVWGGADRNPERRKLINLFSED